MIKKIEKPYNVLEVFSLAIARKKLKKKVSKMNSYIICFLIMPPKKIALDNESTPKQVAKPTKKEPVKKEVVEEPVKIEEPTKKEPINKLVEPVKKQVKKTVTIEEDEEQEEEEVEEVVLDKRKKDTFDDLVKIIDTSAESKKKLDTEILELEKTLKLKKLEQAKVDKTIVRTSSMLCKAHTQELTKAGKKTRAPREGSPVKTGFNKEHPVPKQLVTFLGLEENTEMTRPKVYSAFSTKCKELGLKNGKNTVLNEEAVKLLGLPKSDVGKIIPFTGGQSFLSTFYPKKEKTLVSSSASDNLAVEDDEDEEE